MCVSGSLQGYCNGMRPACPVNLSSNRQGRCGTPVLGQALHQAAHGAHVYLGTVCAACRAAPVAGCLVLRLELLRQRRKPRAHCADMLMPQLHLRASRLSEPPHDSVHGRINSDQNAPPQSRLAVSSCQLSDKQALLPHSLTFSGLRQQQQAVQGLTRCYRGVRSERPPRADPAHREYAFWFPSSRQLSCSRT